MSDLILHQYPESPFSEKIRSLLGYKGLAYRSVTIPVIMPKPDLMPLTGGYRRTPVMQMGADVYCDSALICQVIDRIAPDKSIYPAASLAMSIAAAQWMDSVFFPICVSMAFQPAALATNPLFQDEAAAAAFMADRAKLAEGGRGLLMDLAQAKPQFLAMMENLDRQLQERDFLFGEQPTIADFSAYHQCWFVHQIEAIRDVFAPFSHVLRWFDSMRNFGHGRPTEMQGSEALNIARDAEPATLSATSTTEHDQLAIGDQVEVVPTDYGLQPVRGSLLMSSLDELVIHRQDPQLGALAVHFPRLGFQISKLD